MRGKKHAAPEQKTAQARMIADKVLIFSRAIDRRESHQLYHRSRPRPIHLDSETASLYGGLFTAWTIAVAVVTDRKGLQ
jgi:hypothetical protein